MVPVSGYPIGSPEANKGPLLPPAELAWWYQFYFATERGRAGYDKYRREFAKLISQTASPVAANTAKIRQRYPDGFPSGAVSRPGDPPYAGE
jgi:hypothetical protein